MNKTDDEITGKIEKMEKLEAKILSVEKENRALRAMLKDQFIFGNKIVGIVSEMDVLLDKKKKEIEILEMNCQMLNESINTLGHALAQAKSKIGLDENLKDEDLKAEDLKDEVIVIEDEETEAEVEDKMEIEIGKEVEAEVEVEVEGVEEDFLKEVEMEAEVEIEAEDKIEAEIECQGFENAPMLEAENEVEKEEKKEVVVNEVPDKMHFERTEDGKFKCPYASCGHVTKYRVNLKYHIREIHTGEKPYSCDYCEETFSRADRCRNHMATHEESGLEPTEKGKIEPEAENEVLQDSEGFENQPKLAAEKQEKVPVMANKEPNEIQFEKTDDGKYKCPYTDICGHVSQRRDTLMDHVRIHTGERYCCDHCGKKFVWSASYRRHMLTHDQKSVNCEICRKRFKSTDIKNHILKCSKRGDRIRKISGLLTRKRPKLEEKPKTESQFVSFII